MKSILAYLTMGALLLCTMASLPGCSSDSRQKQTKEPRQPVSGNVFIDVDKLLAEAATLTDKQVQVEGVCTHICQHGGGKIFLMGTDDTKTIRIEAGEKIGSFKPETVNSIVRVTGVLKELRIDEAYLIDWEAQAADQTNEKHGTDEAGCDTEQKAQGEAKADSEQERIDNFRKRIAERETKEGKNYLSFYHVAADKYAIE